MAISYWWSGIFLTQGSKLCFLHWQMDSQSTTWEAPPKFTQLLNDDILICTQVVKLSQLCLILCEPMDYTVHGIL